MARVQVTAAVAVLPTVDGREQYLYQGAIVDSDGFTEKGIEHARAQSLIGDAPEIVEEEPVTVFSQEDVDAAVKAATDAKDAELAEARKAVEDRALEVAQSIKQLEAARAESGKVETAKASTTKTTAAKQS